MISSSQKICPNTNDKTKEKPQKKITIFQDRPSWYPDSLEKQREIFSCKSERCSLSHVTRGDPSPIVPSPLDPIHLSKPQQKEFFSPGIHTDQLSALPTLQCLMQLRLAPNYVAAVEKEPPRSKCWDDRHVTPYPASFHFLMRTMDFRDGDLMDKAITCLGFFF